MVPYREFFVNAMLKTNSNYEQYAVHYVTGYGYSGSTLLGRLKGREHNCVVVGEAQRISNATFIQNAMCSCGKTFTKCQFWAEVDKTLNTKDVSEEKTRQRHWLEGWLGLLIPMAVLRKLVKATKFSERYMIPFPEGCEVLANVGGGSFVDTSKTTRKSANRPRMLAAAGLHVVPYMALRPLRDVIKSYRKHNKEGRFGTAASLKIGRAHV